MTTPRSFTEVLDDCLDRVLSAGESVESCVADYPEHTEELRDELEAALAMQAAFAYQPDVDRERANRVRMYDALESGRGRIRFQLPRMRGLLSTGPRVAAAALVAVLAVVGSGTGTVLASQGSAPGDLLYPLKRTTERVQLAFTLTDSREADLREELLDRRIEELDTVTAEGRERFVPELVEEIVHHSERARELAAAPVREVVDPPARNTSDVPSDEVTGSDGDTPTPRPHAPTATKKKEVSVRPVLTLAEQLSKVEARVVNLEKRVTRDQSKANLERLRQALASTRQQLDMLLASADLAHLPVPPGDTHPATDNGRGDVTPAPTPSRPRAETPEAPADVERVERVKARIRDVTLHQDDGKLVRVDVEVELPNGNHRPIQVTRGGTRLLKDGKAAGVRQLKPGGRVELVVEPATGKVRAIVIASDDDGERPNDGRDDQDRRQGGVVPSTPAKARG